MSTNSTRSRNTAKSFKKTGPEPVTVVIVLAIAALVLLAVFGVRHAAANNSTAAQTAAALAKYGKAPTGVTPATKGVLVTGKDVYGPEAATPKGKPATVTIFEDYQCPACKSFNDAYGDKLNTLLKDGKVEIDYRPIAFLDKASTTKYSSRAMNAAMCVLDLGGKGAFHQVTAALYGSQPEEGTAGLDQRQLATLADKTLLKGSISACSNEKGFMPFVKAATEKAANDGHRQTPTVLVNGVEVPNTTTFEDFTQELDVAIAKATA